MKPIKLIVVCLSVIFAVGCGEEPIHISDTRYYEGLEMLRHLAEVADGANVKDIFPRGLDINVQWIYAYPDDSKQFYEYNLDDVSWYSSDSIPESYANQERVIGFIEFNKPLDSMKTTRAIDTRNKQNMKNRIYINDTAFHSFEFVDAGCKPAEYHEIIFVDIDGNKTRYVMMYNESFDQYLDFLNYYPLKAFAGAMIVAGKAR